MANLLNVEGKEYTASILAAKQFGYTKDYLLLLIKDGKIDGQKVGNKWYVHVPSAEAFFKNAKVRREVRRKEISLERKNELKSHGRVRFTGNHRTAIVETLAIVIIGLSLGATGYIGTTGNQTAYVGEGASHFLESFAVSLYRFVYREEEVSGTNNVDTSKDTEQETNSVTVRERDGVIVLTEESGTDERMEEIRNSFSDTVQVSIDASNPDTGIIVPDFKGGEDESYRFLLVPITQDKVTAE